MSFKTLYDKDNVTVLLHDFFFDQSIDSVYAVIEVQNYKCFPISVAICDLWNGEQFLFDDFAHEFISNVPPNTTVKKTIIELSDLDEDGKILKFQQGYSSAFSFRIALYSHHPDNSYETTLLSKGCQITITKFSMQGVSVDTVDAFNIEYDGITLWAAAKYCIPFQINHSNTEKNKQIKSFKNKLENRIRAMELDPEDILVAQYGELGKPRFFDIENMCIYNLGTSVFSECCPTDIAFMELTKQEIETHRSTFFNPSDWKYFYAYAPFQRNALALFCDLKPLIAKWEGIIIDRHIPNSPFKYWKSIRSQINKVTVYEKLKSANESPYGLKITLHLPKKVLPASIMKPLLDGVVCAFHKHCDPVPLHQILNEDFNTLVAGIETDFSLFGVQNYLQAYRNKTTIKWNPADERLKFAWVSIIEEDYIPFFDGEIYQW